MDLTLTELTILTHAPTLPAPLPARFKNDNDMYGAVVPIKRASEAGYVSEPVLETAEMVDELRQKAAMVWFFRYNNLPPSAQRACENIKLDRGSRQTVMKPDRYTRMEQRWKSATLGMPAHEPQDLSSHWFLSWVASAVSHHDWIAHMSNIQLKFHHWKCNDPGAEGASRANAMRGARRLFDKQRSCYRQVLETALQKEANDFPKLMSLAVARKNELLAAWKASVQQLLDTVKEFDPYPFDTTMQALEMVPPSIRPYSDCSPGEKVQFFEKLVTRDLYAAFYEPVCVAVSIAANLADESMGELMSTTVIHCAIATEQFYFRPWSSNRRWEKSHPEETNPDRQIVQPRKIHIVFRRIDTDYLKKIAGFPTGIDEVLVPEAGRDQKKRRYYEDPEESGVDFPRVHNTFKRARTDGSHSNGSGPA